MTFSLKAGVLTVSISALLSACGGSGGSSSSSSFDSFDDIEAAATGVVDTYIDDNGDLQSGVNTSDFDTADAPSGSVTYSGFVTGVVDDANLIGTMTVRVDFSSDDVTTSATDFFSETDGAYNGTLSGEGVVNSTATGNIPQFTAELEGDLTNGGVTFETSLGVEGDFLTVDDNDFTAIAGLVEGSVGSNTFDDGFFAVED